MDTPFPFGLPAPTAKYLGLYIVTLTLHVVFMSYVLGGATVLVILAPRPGRGTGLRGGGLAAEVLRDWLPFMLGAAVTAGVAPLLFVQILYQKAFYTANLLLHHRWMAVVPVLIAVFYLLYLSKCPALGQAWRLWRWPVAIGAWLGLAFTACSWMENHLLSLDRSTWPAMYESQRMYYPNPAIYARFLLWLSGALPMMCTLLGWQIRGRPDVPADTRLREMNFLSRVARGGAVFAGACALACFGFMETDTRAACTGAMAGPYLALAMFGLVLQAAAWTMIARADQGYARWLAAASACGLITIVSTAVVRESVRMRALDIAQYFPAHQRAAEVGGSAVFLAFLVLNTAVIGWCVRTVRRGALPVGG